MYYEISFETNMYISNVNIGTTNIILILYLL